MHHATHPSPPPLILPMCSHIHSHTTAHARLLLHHQVTIQDAVMAITAIECSMMVSCQEHAVSHDQTTLVLQYKIGELWAGHAADALPWGSLSTALMKSNRNPLVKTSDTIWKLSCISCSKVSFNTDTAMSLYQIDIMQWPSYLNSLMCLSPNLLSCRALHSWVQWVHSIPPFLWTHSWSTESKVRNCAYAVDGFGNQHLVQWHLSSLDKFGTVREWNLISQRRLWYISQ